MDKKPPQITLTIFLIKEEFLDVDSFLPSKASLDHYLLKNDQTIIGDLYVKKPIPKPPGWGKFFSEYIDDLGVLGKSSSTAGLLVIGVENRWFAITFGQGRYLLKPESWEERFGLLVTLNSVGQDHIKSIDKQTFDALSTHSKIQSSQEAAPQDFGLDIEQDLVHAVTGSPDNNKLGHRLSGMDSLRVSVSISIKELPLLLSRYQTQFGSKAYQINFPWVDHISEISSLALRTDLDSILISKIRQNDFDRCWMAAPEIVDWANVDGFRYGLKDSKNPKHHDINLQNYLEETKDPQDITIDKIRKRQVFCIGDDDRQIYRWSVYRCIYCEIDHNNESYLLSGGNWYRVTKDFVAEVNDSFAKIPRYPSILPEYDDTSEGEYNERVANGASEFYALMDKKMIQYGGGNNKFEFCDLYTCKKDIIHVKRYGGSSIFSHLFSQGTTSGELFHTQIEFRNLVNQLLPSTHKLKDCMSRPAPAEYQVVFAIVSDSEESDLMIPFFSRLNLRAAFRRLDGYGYRVAITKIPVSKTRSKLKRYRSPQNKSKV